ncbi:PilZ domain-containing protein [Spartinivicinus ruber]|uniref:PilZ domain-containing protein n=1 Tax=Spartinivicinus ruber TaxID=2683272 RepID=UPI0013D60AAC|nr:PilZ domain-containing protein [Spartinivicinus ruber]
MENQRRYKNRHYLRKRIIWNGKLSKIEKDIKHYSFNTVNVSTGGVLIHTQAELEQDSTIQLVIFAFDDIKNKELPIKINARVIHVAKISMQQTESQYDFQDSKQVYQAGLEFDDLSPDTSEFLTNIILAY